jgi:selenide,water dikinase
VGRAVRQADRQYQSRHWRDEGISAAGQVDALDLQARRVSLEGGEKLAYDVISLNPGSRVERSLPGAERTLPVKPLDEFLAALDRQRLGRVAIVGAGAAGAELAMALGHRGAAITLYSDRPTLPGVAGEQIAQALRRAHVDFRPGMAVTAVEQGPVIVAGPSRQDFDLVILATGSAAPAWLASAGLAVDGLGFALVHDTLQSTSHPEVSLGRLRDAARRAAPCSGVYAVRHGERLAANFRNLVGGQAARALRAAGAAGAPELRFALRDRAARRLDGRRPLGVALEGLDRSPLAEEPAGLRR